MKKTYRRDNQFVFYRPGKKPIALFVWPVLLAVVLLLVGDFLLRGLSGASLQVFYPVLKIEQIVTNNTDDLIDFARSKKFLISANSALSKENQELRNLLVSYRALEIENDMLRDELSLPGRTNASASGFVISRPNNLPYDVLLVEIDLEKASQIKPGDLAGIGGVALGKVTEVSGRLVKVNLFSSPGQEIEVVIGREGIQTQASGVGGGNFTASLPRSFSVAVGDVVASDRYPGRLLGLVGEVINTPADPFQIVRFKSPINLYQIEILEFYGL